MLKKYLFSDAEKASVEREIEIQQVRAWSYPQWSQHDASAHLVHALLSLGDITLLWTLQTAPVKIHTRLVDVMCVWSACGRPGLGESLWRALKYTLRHSTPSLLNEYIKPASCIPISVHGSVW